MNYRGSYRRLRDNAVSALVAAIEVYNKPRFAYRDEVVVILVVNAWELLLKALLSKSRQRIFYPKKRGEPYRSFSLDDSLRKAINASSWPSALSGRAIAENVNALSTYRDNAIHFYNEPGLSVVTYSLIQTSVINFKDVLEQAFNEHLSDEITWRLLPIGVNPPVDPLQYLRGAGAAGSSRSQPVQEFLAQLGHAARALEQDRDDTGRLLTVFDAAIKSTKKIESADIVLGLGDANDTDTVIATKSVDPNKSHPLREMDVLARLDDRPDLNQYGWRSVVWNSDMKTNPVWCWKDESTGLTKWSHAAVTHARSFTTEEVAVIRAEYKGRARSSKKAR